MSAEKVGAVVMGRNEGERLKRGLLSLPSIRAVVYVDSGCTCGSPQWAAHGGVEVVQHERRLPFTAARSRDSGFRRLQDSVPNVDYAQFVDGDYEVCTEWVPSSYPFFIPIPTRALCARTSTSISSTDTLRSA